MAAQKEIHITLNEIHHSYYDIAILLAQIPSLARLLHCTVNLTALALLSDGYECVVEWKCF